MVEIEEAYAGKYGIWIDGNEPPASAVLSLTMRPGMDELGISEELRTKHELVNYKHKCTMSKKELWRRLLSARLEQEILNLGSDPQRFDGFLVKPQQAEYNKELSLLIKGVRPAIHIKGVGPRRRITYAQTIVISPLPDSDTSKNVLQTALDKLYFNVSVPLDYDDYQGFERQCRQFLQRMIDISRDEEAYKHISYQTGVEIYRLLP